MTREEFEARCLCKVDDKMWDTARLMYGEVEVSSWINPVYGFAQYYFIPMWMGWHQGLIMPQIKDAEMNYLMQKWFDNGWHLSVVPNSLILTDGVELRLKKAGINPCHYKNPHEIFLEMCNKLKSNKKYNFNVG